MIDSDAHANGEPIVAIDALDKRFGDRRVLDGLHLAIDGGETIALIGPSGGGKSTLLRCINGLAPFNAGEIRVAGHRLLPQPSPRQALRAAQGVRRMVGMVFQDFQLFPHLTARENVASGPRRVLGTPRDEADSLAMRLLDRVGLANRAGDYPRQLSGGQQQRVAIARALALAPKALLCDEVTSALDPELKQDVLAVLEDLRGDGLTLILVTHEIGFARRAADRVVMLADGRIIEEGPAKQLLSQPSCERTRRFLANVLG